MKRAGLPSGEPPFLYALRLYLTCPTITWQNSFSDGLQVKAATEPRLGILFSSQSRILRDRIVALFLQSVIQCVNGFLQDIK